MRPIARLLVGVDFSDASQSALLEAALLGRTLGAELQLLHALPDARGDGFDVRVAGDHAERLVERAASDLEVGGARVRRPFLLPAGQHPADALLAAIAREDPDLVVLGAGAKTQLDRVLLGATAEQVVRESPRPVWLTRPRREHAEVRRIVCAVDASDPAREALAAAAFLARTFVAELHTLTVRTPPDGLRATPAPGRGPLEEALARVDLHGIDHRLATREGKPAVRIVEAVAELGADLLVLGSARRTGLSRLVRGNTAEKVLRQLPCSLLTVPSAAGVGG